MRAKKNKARPIILGVETTCDETSVALVRGRHILANAVLSSMRYHSKYGGVIPEIASRKHLQGIVCVLKESLGMSGVRLEDIDALALAAEPGLPGSLIVGGAFARALAYALGKPLIGVNHIEAHIDANFLVPFREKKIKPEKFPAIGLAVSGGHTTLFFMPRTGEYRAIGTTRDDALGEAFDKVARILGLGYPGGPHVERLAKKSSRPFYFKRTYLENGSLDFSFSGIKTAVLYNSKHLIHPAGRDGPAREDLCAGFQESVFDVVTAKCVAACKKHRAYNLYVGGGVACNEYLRRRLKREAAKTDIEAHFPDKSLCQDNAAMIAGLGAVKYLKRKQDGRLR